VGVQVETKVDAPNLKDDSSSASDEDFEPSDEGSDEKPRVNKRKRVDRKKVESDDEDASDMESASSDDSDVSICCLDDLTSALVKI
jgi:hypothetical protein